MTHPSSEAKADADGSRRPRDQVSNSAGSSDHAAPASRRSWFRPAVEDFEITPEAAMYAGRR
jgi:hypothetical protein